MEIAANAPLTSFATTRRLSSFCWGVLIYLFAVILWGSFVRASGSGAGCGSHWPLCNGVVIPEPGNWKTLVEFTHRVTSGISLILCGAIGVWGYNRYPNASLVRRAAIATGILILSEAAVGAGLVLFGLVDQNQSHLRAISLGIHLMNTFFLLAAVVLTARWSEIGATRLRRLSAGQLWSSVLAILFCLGLGASGAVTALGDTLFPAASLQAGLAQDLSPTRHFLIELRIYHPVIAVLVSFYLILFARAAMNLIGDKDPAGSRLRFHAWMVLVLQCMQLTLGVLNIALLAPIAVQMAHLLMADLVWINLILLLSEIWTETRVAAKVEARFET
jgi:cytochrome c oxidase assembly protein subunit 15